MSREDNLKELNRLQNVIKEAEEGIDRLFQGTRTTQPTDPTKRIGRPKGSKNKPADDPAAPTNGHDTERPLEVPYTGDASPAG